MKTAWLAIVPALSFTGIASAQVAAYDVSKIAYYIQEADDTPPSIIGSLWAFDASLQDTL